MLASRLPGILPPLNEVEALETAAIASVSTQGLDLSQWGIRPFRAPHHTASAVALVGGGGQPRPGEISLAHHGVLFLDELPEYERRVLEVLREPLESGRITISRAARQADFPARFQLVAAMNPCRCGHGLDPGYACRKGPNERCMAQYQARISGPLLDRIDLRIEVPAVSAADLILPAPTEGSAEAASRVAAARERQSARYAEHDLPPETTNATCPAKVIEAVASPDAQGSALIRQAAETMRLSARSFHRVLRVARTLADLDGEGQVRRMHLAEALSYRGRSDATV
jgi:magnesium chelatase family protein